jgi:hypothetical protein
MKLNFLSHVSQLSGFRVDVSSALSEKSHQCAAYLLMAMMMKNSRSHDDMQICQSLSLNLIEPELLLLLLFLTHISTRKFSIKSKHSGANVMIKQVNVTVLSRRTPTLWRRIEKKSSIQYVVITFHFIHFFPAL